MASIQSHPPVHSYMASVLRAALPSRQRAETGPSYLFALTSARAFALKVFSLVGVDSPPPGTSAAAVGVAWL